MSDSFFDRFFFHMAQQNYEECFRLSDSSYAVTMDPRRSVKSLISFDMLYFNISHMAFKNTSQDQALRDIYKTIREQYLKIEDTLFKELVFILDIKMKLIEIYRYISTSTTITPALVSECDECTRALNKLQNYEIAPYRETLSYEILAIKHLIVAHLSLSDYNYLHTILNLTQSHTNLQQWYKVFSGKKYSPHYHNNSTVDYNMLYSWLVRLLHMLIYKASLYFESYLSNTQSLESMEYGSEYINSYKLQLKCVDLKINYAMLILDCSNTSVASNWSEGGYRCNKEGVLETHTKEMNIVYKFRFKSDEMPPDTESNIYNTLLSQLQRIKNAESNYVEIQDFKSDCTFLFGRVDRYMYLAFAYPNRRSGSEVGSICELFSNLSQQLKSLTPKLSR
jgi:hypothetical protein